ncbi:MAG: hypothetical protein HC927_09785 [Deltaproteobacteria bacterium]|nr:hypothetical protein [Deltaproteobacteria bacterium]
MIDRRMTTPSANVPHAWQRVGDIVVSFTASGAIDDEVWLQFVSALGEDGVRMAFAVTVDEAFGISATQRKSAAEVMQARNLSAVAVTNSRVLRGVLTAVSWLGAKVKAYPWDALDAAVDATGATPEQKDQLRQLALGFRKATS